jgi:hypothetical protein
VDDKEGKQMCEPIGIYEARPRRITKRRDGSSYLYMQVLEFFRVFSKIENTIVSLIQGGEARRPPPPPRVQCFSSGAGLAISIACPTSSPNI